jgi:hypothetical protein
MNTESMLSQSMIPGSILLKEPAKEAKKSKKQKIV